MRKRTQSREYCIQLMYQIELLKDSFDGDIDKYIIRDLIKSFWLSFPDTPDDIIDYTEVLFNSSYANTKSNDLIISQFLKDGWIISRIGFVERVVLRVAIDELINTDTPAYAILDDYVTITKKFTDEQTASFVNGLLEKVRSTFKPEKSNKVSR